MPDSHLPAPVCIVRDAEGHERYRSDDLAACRVEADRLGVGAYVEVFCVIYRVTTESLSDPAYDLFNE